MAPEADTPLPFDWEGSPKPDETGGPPPSAPAARRLGPRLLAAAVGAAVLGGALAVVLSGGGSPSAGQGGPVALAAAVTNREAGFKFTMTASANVGGQSADVNASGSVNTGPPASVSMTASVGGTSVEERIIGGDLYIQSGALTGGKWLQTSLPVGISGDTSTSGSTQLTSADPAQTLDYLRAAGTVTDVGSDTIDGVAATHYHADIDLSRYVAMLPAAQQAAAQQGIASFEQETGTTTLPIDVWIDASNLVRQMQFDLSLPNQGSVSLSMTLSDYGSQPAVTAPPAGDVVQAPAAQTPSAPAPTTSAPVQTPSSPPASTPSSGSVPSQPAD
jgi:hypothetical protein